MPLSDLACRKAKPGAKRRKISDMGCLQLWIYPNGAKYWRLAYRFRGKQKILAIGVYPRVSLIEARAAREAAKVQLREGVDPMQGRARAKIEREMAIDSFETVAKEYVQNLRREGRAEITVEKVEWVLGHAYPILGPMAVRSIRPADVLAVLRKVESKGRYETARRLRSTIGAVCRYAVATARADVDPTIALKGALMPAHPFRLADQVLRQPSPCACIAGLRRCHRCTHDCECARNIEPTQEVDSPVHSIRCASFRRGHAWKRSYSYLNLAQQRHYLFSTEPLLRHDLVPFQAKFSYYAWSKNPRSGHTFLTSDTVNTCHLHRLISEDYFAAYHGQKNFCLVDLKGRNLQ